MQNQLHQIGERRRCTVCGNSLVYGTMGWLHVRKPAKPHVPSPTPAMDDVPLVTVLQARIAELEAMVEVQGNRIRTALAENAKLAEKVKR